jgi:glutamate-1-semialdehyde 2,1-aminomutase
MMPYFDSAEKTACYMLNRKSIKANNIVFTINRIGSMISVHFATPVVDLKLPQMETMKRLKNSFMDYCKKNLYCAISL